jgi:hypothetical protein
MNCGSPVSCILWGNDKKPQALVDNKNFQAADFWLVIAKDREMGFFADASAFKN